MAIKGGVVALVRTQMWEVIKDDDLPKGPETFRERYRAGVYKGADWKDVGEIDVQYAHTDNFIQTQDAADFVRRTIHATSDCNAAMSLGDALQKAINEEIELKVVAEGKRFLKTAPTGEKA
jgi:hypothetical protein